MRIISLLYIFISLNSLFASEEFDQEKILISNYRISCKQLSETHFLTSLKTAEFFYKKFEILDSILFDIFEAYQNKKDSRLSSQELPYLNLICSLKWQAKDNDDAPLRVKKEMLQLQDDLQKYFINLIQFCTVLPLTESFIFPHNVAKLEQLIIEIYKQETLNDNDKNKTKRLNIFFNSQQLFKKLKDQYINLFDKIRHVEYLNFYNEKKSNSLITTVRFNESTSLPSEIWLNIFSYLDDQTLAHTVPYINHYFKVLTLNKNLWQLRYNKNVPLNIHKYVHPYKAYVKRHYDKFLQFNDNPKEMTAIYFKEYWNLFLSLYQNPLSNAHLYIIPFTYISMSLERYEFAYSFIPQVLPQPTLTNKEIKAYKNELQSLKHHIYKNADFTLVESILALNLWENKIITPEILSDKIKKYHNVSSGLNDEV